MSFGNSFVQGLQSGEDSYYKYQDLVSRRKADARAEAEAEQRRIDFDNRQRDRTNEDTAYRGMTGLRTNGVMTGNQSGMSDASASALNNSGGQGLVDATARLGNQEAGMLGDSAMPGAAPSYQVSGQGQPQYDDSGASTGMGLAPQKTITSRAANPRDNLQAGYALAAAKRAGPEVFAALDQKSRELDKEDIYGKVGKMSDDDIRAMLPGLNASQMSGLPIYDAGDVLDAKGKPTGYRELKLVKNGKSEFVQVSPAQLRQIATSHALMEGGFAQDGLAMLSTVNKDMGELVGKFNGTLKGTVDTGNTAMHQRATDQNGAVTAGAAAMNAKTNKAYKDKMIEGMDNAEARRVEAGKLMLQLNSLDVNDPQYNKKRRDILTQIDTANLKPGGQVSLRDPSVGSGAAGAQAAKYQADNVWSDIEKKMRGDGNKEEDIASQRSGFYANRGFAPDDAVKQLMDPRKPSGELRTADDIEDFNRHFPNTPIDPATVPWMQTSPKPAQGLKRTTGTPRQEFGKLVPSMPNANPSSTFSADNVAP